MTPRAQRARYEIPRAEMSRARRLPRGAQPRRERGAALVVGLVLLLVLTILGVSGLSTAALEVAMAGNAQFQHDAFELAENAIDIVIAERLYATEGSRTLAWRGTPDADREAVTTFIGATPVYDRAFSVSAVEALHFEVAAQGRGPRNAETTLTQGFYVIAATR
jgi:type IV pilus assembly protein PilX